MYNQLFIGLLNCFPLSNRTRSHREPFLDFTFHFIFLFLNIDVLEKPLRMRWRVSGYRKGERERGDCI